jgi:two-component system chemotaxis response regulator CheY
MEIKLMSTEVLIVDDCKVTSKILSRFMQELGFTVSSVGSGEAAVEFLSLHKSPSLLLVDWVMPGMSGVQLVAWLRSRPELTETPVLMVTGERDLTRVAEALSHGANEYIMKPFSKEILQEKLQLLGIPTQP